MTEIETITRAKMYIEKLANGINPLDDTAVKDDDIINNVRISRCLFFVADTLGEILENGGINPPAKQRKAPFNITLQELKSFRYSETPIPISEIAKRLNEITDTENSKKISHNMIISWLLEIGLLKTVNTADGKTQKRPTEEGYSFGISTEEREGQYGTYVVVIYNKSVQEFIIDNIFSIIDFCSEKNSKENQGKPWTKEHEQQLIIMYEQQASVREIAAKLKRSRGGVREKLKSLGYQI